MARKQSRSPASPIGTGARSARGNGQPNPSSTCPEHVTARSLGAVYEVDRGPLPVWVRRRAANPERTASSPIPETTSESPEFLTVAEAASVLRVSLRTLRRRLAAGEIPHVRVGRQVRIPRKVVLGRRNNRKTKTESYNTIVITLYVNTPA